MKNILICTDCSENAKRATEQCFEIFKGDSKQYSLLNSFSVSDSYSEDVVDIVDNLKVKTNRALTKEFKRIQDLPQFNGTFKDKQAVFGNTENVVGRFIAKNAVDLIVVGSQGGNYHPEKLFGSTTENLIYDFPIPKLIVPQRKLENKKPTQLVIVEESQLKDRKWWSTVVKMSKNQSYAIKLVIITNGKEKDSSSISSQYLDDGMLIHSLHSSSTGNELNESLNRLIQHEKPTLLNINLSDEKLARKLIQTNGIQESVFNEVPFIFQPLRR